MNVCRQLKMLLAAYMRERKSDELSDIGDQMAECSGDELGETVSSNGEPVDMTAECSGDEKVILKNDDKVDTPRKTEPKIVAKKVPICTSRKQEPKVISQNEPSDTDDSDDELVELIERKKRLEREKETLSDAKHRRRAEREQLKAKLQTDVKTLESEVAALSIRYKGARR